MSLDTDDEILQDFLVEAGELLDGLNEQLVELEQNPDDTELLNAVFRGFHTIKGGAGFLNLQHLVTVCHRAEDVFNLLRQGQRRVDGVLMDAVLQVLDVVTRMFDEIRSGQEPGPSDPALLAVLEGLAMPDSAAGGNAPQAASAEVPEKPATPATAGDTPTPAPVRPADDDGSASAVGDDEITDDEFEALLDAIQAEREEAPARPKAAEPAAASAAPPPPAATATVAAAADEISEDEFEQLLDEFHGKGRAPQSPAAQPSSPPPSAPPAGAQRDGPAAVPHEALRAPPGAAGPSAVGTGQSAAPAPASAPTSAPGNPAAKAAAPARPTAPADTSVRVDTKRLDDIMNLVGELVLVRNRLATLRSSMDDEEASKAVGNLDAVTSDLQAAVMKTRMQPIKKVFGRFPRVVRDLARSIGKEVDLELRGEETDLDKNLVEALADPLVHLVRNAVDHGIEAPDERERMGKARAGRVVLAAAQEGDHILLTISDDGKGMDPDALRRKAVEKGLMDQEAAARMTDQNVLNLIFMAGFSTKTEISDVSGRGVGMDVVKTKISQLNGTVDIDSVQGQGSTLRIKVPLTLAIMPTLMVVLGDQRFALPLANVSEIFDLDLSETHHVDEQEVVMVRNQTLPLHYLSKWLMGSETKTAERGPQHVVVVLMGGRRVGFVVDRLIGQEEVVIKPLGAYLHGLPGFAGATITGDGGIALILDVPSLLRAHARRH
ncbi:chemotaxis protein CheA [Thioalkalivibrio sp.]|uniref:chemotaxis protein CheA n=1 Tax=Thioalkalivibrio sp. TaxID=2093813 RepID=UPI0039753A53